MKYKIATIKGAFEVEGEAHSIMSNGIAYLFGISRQCIDPKTNQIQVVDQTIVTELSTGMKVCDDLDSIKAIARAHELVGFHKMESIIERGKSVLAGLNIHFPVNGEEHIDLDKN